MIDHRQIARDNLILYSEVGSRGRGLATAQSDHDYFGVFIEPKEFVIGLGGFEQFIEQTQPKGERAGVDDEQASLFSLRKFAKLAAKGNPSVLELLFIEPLQNNYAGRCLLNSYDIFVSKQAATHYLGYMTTQRMRLEGKRGQKNVKRPELEEKFGFDTKYASQVLLLGLQGVQILTEGRLTIPLSREDREMLLDVRNARGWTKERVIERAYEFETQIKEAEQASSLPAKPDAKGIDQLLVELYEHSWYGDKASVS